MAEDGVVSGTGEGAEPGGVAGGGCGVALEVSVRRPSSITPSKETTLHRTHESALAA